jgi:hypothetical protein
VPYFVVVAEANLTERFVRYQSRINRAFSRNGEDRGCNLLQHFGTGLAIELKTYAHLSAGVHPDLHLNVIVDRTLYELQRRKMPRSEPGQHRRRSGFAGHHWRRLERCQLNNGRGVLSAMNIQTFCG